MACGAEGSALCMSPAEPGDPSSFHTGLPTRLEFTRTEFLTWEVLLRRILIPTVIASVEQIEISSEFQSQAFLEKLKRGLMREGNTVFASIQSRVWAVEGQVGPEWLRTLSHPDVPHPSFLLHEPETN